MSSEAEQIARSRIIQKLETSNPGADDRIMHNIFLKILLGKTSEEDYPIEAAALRVVISTEVARVNLLNTNYPDQTEAGK